MNDRETLLALMEADRWIERVKSQRVALPEIDELRGVEDELRELAARLHSVEAELRPTRDAFNAAADSANSLRQRRSELEARLSTASAPARELAAMNQELGNLTRRLSDAEDTEVALLLELEPMEQVVEEIRTQAQPLAHRRHGLHEAITSLQASLDDELANLRTAREITAEAVPSMLRRRYDTALVRSGISGAACFDGVRCDGCRISLAPVDADRIKALGENQFLDCPSCGRLLVTC
jgi:predicted  nucleic acid-binding Zn-ribbon protein